MKKLGIAVIALSASAHAFAGTGETNIATASIGATASSGNTATATLTNGAAGYIVRALSISLSKQLQFPDLVAPTADGDVSSVTVQKDAGGGVVVSYTGNGSPASGLATGSGTAGADGITNGGDNTLAAVMGKVNISGHINKVIDIAITPTTDLNVAADGYSVSAILDQTSQASDGGYILNAVGGGINEGKREIEFGGTLSVDNTVYSGYISADLDVTVSYRSK